MIRLEDFEEGSYGEADADGFFTLYQRRLVIYRRAGWWITGFSVAKEKARIERTGRVEIVPFSEVKLGAIGL